MRIIDTVTTPTFALVPSVKKGRNFFSGPAFKWVG